MGGERGGWRGDGTERDRPKIYVSLTQRQKVIQAERKQTAMKKDKMIDQARDRGKERRGEREREEGGGGGRTMAEIDQEVH